MVKEYLLICVMLLGFSQMKAQDMKSEPFLKNEASFAICALPLMFKEDGEVDLRKGICFNLRLNHYLKKHIAVGGNIGYAIGGPSLDGGSCNDHSALCVVGNAKWAYINNKCFGMYMRAGLGLQCQQDHDNYRIKGAYQLTPLGIEGGSKNVRAFIEYGVGMEGSLFIGLSYRFD